MNTEQRESSQSLPTGDRQDQARKHQVLFPGLMDADLEFVAANEIQLLDGLEARLHQNLYDIIEIVRKLAGRASLKYKFYKGPIVRGVPFNNFNVYGKKRN